MEDTRISNQAKEYEQSIENLRKAMLCLTDNQKEIQDVINEQIKSTNNLIHNQRILELNEIGNESRFKFIRYLIISSILIVGLKDIELSILLLINFIIFFIGMKKVDNKVFHAMEILSYNEDDKGDED